MLSLPTSVLFTAFFLSIMAEFSEGETNDTSNTVVSPSPIDLERLKRGTDIYGLDGVGLQENAGYSTLPETRENNSHPRKKRKNKRTVPKNKKEKQNKNLTLFNESERPMSNQDDNTFNKRDISDLFANPNFDYRSFVNENQKKYRAAFINKNHSNKGSSVYRQTPNEDIHFQPEKNAGQTITDYDFSEFQKQSSIKDGKYASANQYKDKERESFSLYDIQNLKDFGNFQNSYGDNPGTGYHIESIKFGKVFDENSDFKDTSNTKESEFSYNINHDSDHQVKSVANFNTQRTPQIIRVNDLVPSEWSDNSKQNIPSDWNNNLKQTVPFDWNDHLKQNLPSDWSNGLKQSIPSSWNSNVKQDLPSEWSKILKQNQVASQFTIQTPTTTTERTITYEGDVTWSIGDVNGFTPYFPKTSFDTPKSADVFSTNSEVLTLSNDFNSQNIFKDNKHEFTNFNGDSKLSYFEPFPDNFQVDDYKSKVAVPVIKPFPVKIPIIKNVYHQAPEDHLMDKYSDEMLQDDESEDDEWESQNSHLKNTFNYDSDEQPWEKRPSKDLRKTNSRKRKPYSEIWPKYRPRETTSWPKEPPRQNHDSGEWENSKRNVKPKNHDSGEWENSKRNVKPKNQASRIPKNNSKPKRKPYRDTHSWESDIPFPEEDEGEWESERPRKKARIPSWVLEKPPKKPRSNFDSWNENSNVNLNYEARDHERPSKIRNSFESWESKRPFDDLDYDSWETDRPQKHPNYEVWDSERPRSNRNYEQWENKRPRKKPHRAPRGKVRPHRAPQRESWEDETNGTPEGPKPAQFGRWQSKIKLTNAPKYKKYTRIHIRGRRPKA